MRLQRSAQCLKAQIGRSALQRSFLHSPLVRRLQSPYYIFFAATSNTAILAAGRSYIPCAVRMVTLRT